MSLTEQTRHRLHQYLEEHMDHDLATEIMEWLPRGDFATKDDIAQVRVDIEALRTATKADIEGLRAATTTEFAHQGETLGLRIQQTADQVRAEFHGVMRQHTIVLVGTIVVLNGMLASAARIF